MIFCVDKFNCFNKKHLCFVYSQTCLQALLEEGGFPAFSWNGCLSSMQWWARVRNNNKYRGKCIFEGWGKCSLHNTVRSKIVSRASSYRLHYCNADRGWLVRLETTIDRWLCALNGCWLEDKVFCSSQCYILHAWKMLVENVPWQFCLV